MNRFAKLMDRYFLLFEKNNIEYFTSFAGANLAVLQIDKFEKNEKLESLSTYVLASTAGATVGYITGIFMPAIVPATLLGAPGFIYSKINKQN